MWVWLQGRVIKFCYLNRLIKKKQRKKTKRKKKINEEKEKKIELTGLTLQTRLTRQTRDPCHESLITKLNRKN